MEGHTVAIKNVERIDYHTSTLVKEAIMVKYTSTLPKIWFDAKIQ